MLAQTGTQSIDRAAQLLVLVIEGSEPRSVGELAAASGLPKSTASRLVGSLERAGLVQRDGSRGAVRPGPVLGTYAARGSGDRDLAELAAPVLRRLAEVSGETVNLAVPSAHGVVMVAQIDARHVLGAGNWLNRRVPNHASAVGKVFLAFGPARLGRGGLERITASTIVDRRLLEVDLAAVRARGYATAVDELEPGLAAVAAPVEGQLGRTIAAVSISGPTIRMAPERRETLGRLCVEQAASLARTIGTTTASEGAA